MVMVEVDCTPLAKVMLEGFEEMLKLGGLNGLSLPNFIVAGNEVPCA